MDAPQSMDPQTSHRLVPKLWETLPDYTRPRFFADLIAGVTVGLVALPLAMAFAISSGVPPEAGIYTAIIAGIIVSALGGSRCQIAGPTGAFMVLVGGIVAQFGVSGLLMCTAMAGLMLIVMGVTGLGTTVRFIPRSVTIGFTNGIAVIIATTQLREFLGLTMTRMPDDFVGRMVEIGRALPTTDATTAALSVCTLLALILCATLKTRIPGTIVALVAGTATAHMLGVHPNYLHRLIKNLGIKGLLNGGE